MIDCMSMNKWSVIFLTGFFLLPYLFLTSHFSPYEPIKVYFIIFWSLLLALSGKHAETVKVYKPLLFTSLALVISVWVSSLLNGSLLQSIYGNPYRADGLIALSSLLLISLSFAHNYDENTNKYLTLIARINAVVIPIITFIYPKLGWLLGNPVIMSGYLVMLAPLTLQSLENRRDKLWKFISLTSIFLTAIFLQVWGALLAFLMMFILKAFKLNIKYLTLVCGVLLIVGIGYFSESYNRGFTAESRTRILSKGMIAVAKKPIMGWGWSNFAKAFKEIDFPEHYEIEAYVDRPHSSIMDYAIAGGIPSLLLYFSVIYLTGKQLLQSKNGNNFIWFLILSVYVIHSQTNVTSVAEDLFFWLSVGRAIGS